MRSPFVAAWLALLLVCGVVVAQTKFSADLSAFLPRSPTPAQRALVEQLKDGVVSRLVLAGIHGAAPDRLAQYNKALAAALRADPRFVAVNNGEDITQGKDRDFIFAHRYLLSPRIEPGYFGVPQLRASLENALELLSSEAGMLAKSLVASDPTGEVLRIADELAGAAAPPMHAGVWSSRDLSYSLLLVQTRAAGFDMDAQHEAIAAIRTAFATVAGEAGSEVRLDLVGPGVFSVLTRDVIKGDAERFAMIASVLVALMLWVVLRSFRLLALGLLPVASGVLAGIAAVSLFHGEVHGITLGFGATLIGESVDYAIYLLVQSEARPGERASLRHLWPMLRLGVLTSICGFSALFFSSFPGLAQLGLFSIAGLIAAVLVTRFVLPELLPRGFQLTGMDKAGAYLYGWLGRARTLRPWLALATGIAIAFLIYRSGDIWQDELAGLSPVPLDAQKLDERLRGELGAPDVRHLIVVSAEEEQTVLEGSEAVSLALEEAKRQGLIAGYDAPTRYLPSRKTQLARIASLPSDEVLRRNLAEAAAGMPFDAQAFAPFVEQAGSARQMQALERGALAGTQLSLRYDSLVLQRENRWFAMLPLTQVTDAARLSDALAPLLSEQVALLDLKQETDGLYRGYRQEIVLLSTTGAGIIVLLLAVSLRSAKRALNVCVPIAMSVALTIGVLLWAKHTLTIFNLVGVLLVVAVGSNYALFFERGLNVGQGEGSTAARTTVSLLSANLSTVIGFGLLGFSKVPVLSAIGAVVGLGAVLSLLCAAALSSEFSKPNYPRTHA